MQVTTTDDKVQQFMTFLVQDVDPKLRREQLEHEWDRILWYNCTLSNALLQQLLRTYHDCIIHNVLYEYCGVEYRS